MKIIPGQKIVHCGECSWMDTEKCPHQEDGVDLFNFIPKDCPLEDAKEDPYVFDLQRAIDNSNKADKEQNDAWVAAGCPTCEYRCISCRKQIKEKLGIALGTRVTHFQSWNDYWKQVG